MIFLTSEDVLALHRSAILRHGGAEGVRDEGAVESAVAQPQMAFGGVEMYSDISEKAAALGYSLVCNHPFVDGNKRTGYVAMETFLVLNGFELTATIDDVEQTMLKLAAGELSREELVAWIRRNLATLEGRA
jgi:death on curing protein